MTEIKLMESKELREQMAARVDVLDKVKKLFLLPKLDMVTAQQIADYYEVDYNAIRMCYHRNKDEINEDGVKMEGLDFWKEHFVTSKNSTRGSMSFVIDDNTIITIPNAGINLFSKRAVLRIGMLLRDSVIAQEVRTQLLNAFEKMEDDKKVEDIETEQDIMGQMGLAFASGDIMAFCEATMKYNAFKQRHIDWLTEKIDTDKPKVLFAETFGSGKDTISVGQYAKLLCNKWGINIGRTRLFDWMREHNILDNGNIPYQKYMNAGWFKVVSVQKPQIKKNIPTTRITAKGQQKLFDLIAKDYEIINREA